MATGVGKAVLRVPSLTGTGSINEITLSEVWYVPDLSANLLSIHTLNCKGLSLNFAVDLMTTISNLNVPIAYAHTENQLHHLVTMDEDAYVEVLITQIRKFKPPSRHIQENQMVSTISSRKLIIANITSRGTVDSSKQQKSNSSKAMIVSKKLASLEI